MQLWSRIAQTHMHDVNSLNCRNGLGTDASQLVPVRQSPSMLFDIVCWRAAHSPQRVALRYLADDDQGDTSLLTYGELNARARGVAECLQQAGAAGERVLLVANPGLDFVTSFFGCLYAGAVAVPAYPPAPFRLHRTLPRLQAIIANAEARFMIASDLATHPLCKQFGSRAWDAAHIGRDRGGKWIRPPSEPQRLALLQYTSGSTGAPRGVMLTHANILSNLENIERTFDVPNAVGVHWLPPYHDLGLIGGVLTPCFSGREAILMSPLSFMQRPLRWLQAIDRYRATTTGGPNFGFEHCVRKIKAEDCGDLDLSCLEVVVCGAERIRPGTLRAFAEKFAPFGFRPSSVVAAYGLAEATVMVSAADIHDRPRIDRFCARAMSVGRALALQENDAAIELVSCGRSIDQTVVRIVDPNSRQELPSGHVGEVWVQGPSVGQGYWDNPSATAETFFARLSANATDAYLRTGDLGFLHDGELYITGRDKELLILGGRNYYPQDIELALSESHPVLRAEASAAFSVDTEAGEELVVVFEVRRPHTLDLSEIMQGLRRAAVESFELLPQAVVLIPAGSLPKTSSGKIRRVTCRERFLDGTLPTLAQWTEEVGPTAAASADEPFTENEKALAAIWQSVLNVPRVGRQDDFLQLGGQSLAISEMLLRVQERWHTKLDVQTAFENPTLEAMARILDRRAANVPLAPIAPASASEHRLSFTQEGFWFMEQLGSNQGSAAIVAATITLQGTVKEEHLHTALDLIVGRHAALRTAFQARQGIPYQIVCANVHVPMEVVDLGQLTASQRDSRRSQIRESYLQTQFNLAQPPLLRSCLLKISDESYEVLLIAHHLICDELSLGRVLEELAATYGNRRDESSEESIEFVDFASWERQQYEQNGFTHDLEYWRRRLDGCVERLELPSDFARPRNQVSCLERTKVMLDQPTTRSLQALAQECGATPYMVYLTVFQELLAHYCGQQDINIAIPVSRRDHPQLNSLVGCLLNTVVTRRVLQPGETLRESLLRTRELLLGDLSHAEVPFEKVVETVQPQRTWGVTPLAQVLLINRDAPSLAGAKWSDEIEVDRVDIDASGIAGFDLALIVNSEPTSSFMEMAYNQHLFLPQTIEHMLEYFATLVQAVVSEPDQPLDKLLHDFPAGPIESVGPLKGIECRTAYEQFQRQVDSTPHLPAVEFHGSQWTYAQLMQRVDKISLLLHQHWVESGDRVAISLSRGVNLVAAMLATWRLGAAYVPLDRQFPEKRIKDVLEDCQPRLFLTDTASCPAIQVAEQMAILTIGDEGGEAKCDKSVSVAPARQCGSSTAYVIYTSGSTGRAKGVAVNHRAVVNLLQSMATAPGLSTGQRVLAHTTVTFDISVLELFLPLTTGGTVVLASDDDVGDGSRLRQLIETSLPDMIQATPSAFRLLLDSGWRPTAQQQLLCGGESLNCDLAEILSTHAGNVWNVYGPTETTVWSTIFKVPRGLRGTRSGTIPIGSAIHNTCLRVIDARNHPVPLGAIGELCIGGDGVAQGYWKKAELTEQKFVTLNGKDARYFRTGDLVRWRGDGALEFLCRADDQVKVRGFRVELGEVEAALQNHPLILEAAVQLQDGQRLCAYYVPNTGCDEDLTPADICRHLRLYLPDYMVPSMFVRFSQLPRTVAGKIARHRLPHPDAVGLERTLPFQAPQTPLEKQIAELWQQMLNVPRVGKYDNFFELGGQSLIATQMLARLQEQFSAHVSLRDLYEGPSVSELASRIVAHQAESLDEDELQDLLAEVDGLSDSQAGAYLRDAAEPVESDDGQRRDTS